MEKRWKEENERIMSLHPPDGHYPEPGQPDEMSPLEEVSEPTLPFDETQPGEELPPEQRPLP
jgi:sec-independent protein translocase protein TatB